MSSNIFELLNNESSKKKKTVQKEESKTKTKTKTKTQTKTQTKTETKAQPQKAPAKKPETGAKKAVAPSKAKDAKPAQKGGAGNKSKAPAGGQRKAGGAGRGGAVGAGGAGGSIDSAEKKNRIGNRREVSKDRNRDNHYKQNKDKTGTDGPRGKRTFERRSGTGRAANENKKGGSGRGNWGRNDGTEQLKATDAETTEEVAPKTEETTEAPREREEKVKEEEDKTMTLEDYRKSQASVRVKVSKAKKARKANEGEDESKWADFTPLTKVDELAALKKVAVTKEKEPTTQENKKTKKKTTKKVPLSDIIDTRGGNNGGKPKGAGRGRGAGSFDKKPARGPKKPSQASKLSLDDDSSFPALG